MPFVPEPVAFSKLKIDILEENKWRKVTCLEELITLAKLKAARGGIDLNFIYTAFHGNALILSKTPLFIWGSGASGDARRLSDAHDIFSPETTYTMTGVNIPHLFALNPPYAYSPRLIWANPFYRCHQPQDWWNHPCFSELQLTYKE